jgi:hypothetical protein
MNTLPRIYADFNKADGRGRVILTTVGTQADLETLNLNLSEGLRVLLYMPDYNENEEYDPLEVEATIRRDEERGWWIGEYVWEELDYVSKKTKAGGDGR